jgi:hypothetical protein
VQDVEQLEARHAVRDGAVRTVAEGAPDARELRSAGQACVGCCGIELVHHDQRL